MNTSKPELIAKTLEDFVAQSKKDKNYWQAKSEIGIKRVREDFNWKSYSQRMINLAKLYGFWRYAVSGKGMLELDRYCDLIYQDVGTSCRRPSAVKRYYPCMAHWKGSITIAKILRTSNN